MPKISAAAPTRKRRNAGRPRKGESHLTLSSAKPWLTEGVSRRTWYRRIAEEESASSLRLTAAQKKALGWLQSNTGTAYFDAYRVACSFEHRAGVEHRTWKLLADAGLVSITKRHVTLTMMGRRVDYRKKQTSPQIFVEGARAPNSAGQVTSPRLSDEDLTEDDDL